ncbi:3-oxoacyl-[acyl-carrier-protein] synthase III C-terminal domain-containing protein [Mycobacterium marinum]|uniref:3-oxoacyl-[acyl-carrier-protein] synthase III C-terminal domain-containing protein n=1 Tax=Mycobacterium marinum TaxID=1781 RepID=UPI00356A129E
MVETYVDSFAYSLGERKWDVCDSVAAGRVVSSAEDLEAAGFRWHRVCEPSTSSYDLANRAVTQIADTVGLADIDAIIYSTCLPQNGSVGSTQEWQLTGDIKFLTHFPVSRLQDDFELDGSVVIGLNQQGCSGMLGSIRLAAAMFAVEAEWRRILCVTADRLPETAKYETAYNVMSDSAAACVVTRKQGAFRYIGAHQITNGGLVQADDHETIGTFFTYTHRVVTEALIRTGLRIGDLDWIVTQNTNDKAWQVLAGLLGVDIAKVCFTSLADVAHAISADQIINLVELIGSGRVRAGQRLALVVAGFGMTYQCVILEAMEDLR